MVVELHQLPYDVISVTAYIRICDVYNVYSLTGKRQHVEVHLHLVAVQLEGIRGGHVGFTTRDRQSSIPM